MKNDNEVQIGTKAPSFSLPDKEGNIISLDDFLGKTNIVLYFYPKDESYGCTKEACSFRDNYEDFKDAGAEVIGISPDGETSHREFAAHHKLPFILLSDNDRKVSKLYGVGKTLGLISGRVTFIIDRQGVIRMIYSSQVNYTRHVKTAVAFLKKLT